MVNSDTPESKGLKFTMDEKPAVIPPVLPPPPPPPPMGWPEAMLRTVRTIVIMAAIVLLAWILR